MDIACWAKAGFEGPLFLAGGSVGAAYTAYAAAGAPVNAMTCLNLFDFGRLTDGLGVSRLASLGAVPQIPELLAASLRVLAVPLGWLRQPFGLFGAFDQLMDQRDGDFQRRWDADPIPPRLVSLRSLASTMITPPAIPFERNPVPTLVINQAADRMVHPAVTRGNYQRLGGPKRYLEIPFGHWSSQPAFWEAIVQASHAWFQEYSP